MINRLFGVMITGMATMSLLSGCGGGGDSAGSGAGGPFQLPFSCTNTADSIDGCWVSELCATGAGVAGMRLFEVFDQTVSGPNSGSVTSYLVEYGNVSCTGDPVDATNLNSVANYTQSYAEGNDNTCTDIDDLSMTPANYTCTELDIDITSGSVNTTGYTHYTITDTDNRLCLGTSGFVSDYNYDNTANGGIGLPNEDDELNRPTNIDFTNCLERFTL